MTSLVYCYIMTCLRSADLAHTDYFANQTLCVLSCGIPSISQSVANACDATHLHAVPCLDFIFENLVYQLMLLYARQAFEALAFHRDGKEGAAAACGESRTLVSQIG